MAASVNLTHISFRNASKVQFVKRFYIILKFHMWIL